MCNGPAKAEDEEEHREQPLPEEKSQREILEDYDNEVKRRLLSKIDPEAMVLEYLRMTNDFPNGATAALQGSDLYHQGIIDTLNKLKE